MKDVSQCIIKCAHIMFQRPNSISPTIHGNMKFFPFFSNCIGALDGTHIPANVKVENQKPFRSRKGIISQNVLPVVTFNMTFSFAVVGCEGSAHDGRVLRDSLLKDFPLIYGKFYLGDAGYSLTKYHLKYWAQASEKPQNKKVLFNLRHSS